MNGDGSVNVTDVTTLVQYSYFSFKCAQCNKTQKDFIVENQNSIEENKSFYNDIIFNYCYDCKKRLCPTCSKKHSHKKSLLPVNQLNNKCNEHFNEDNYNFYCITCAENICNNTRETIHKDHFIEVLVKLNPKEENINMIMSKNNLIKMEKARSRVIVMGKKTSLYELAKPKDSLSL